MRRWNELESLARRNHLEALVFERHKHKAETGEDLPAAPVNELPGEADWPSAARSLPKVRSLNAVRHGLTGQTVLMPWEDCQEYDNFCRQFLADLKPVGFEQTQLAQTVADCQWRLNRASAYESAIFYYEAYLAHQDLHEEAIEEEMCKARVAETTQKHLLNITLYESRIQRKMMNARKALKELQKEQSQPRPAELQPISEPRPQRAVPPTPSPRPPIPSHQFGPVDFVFSDLESFCAPPSAPGPQRAAPASRPNNSLAELENVTK